MSTVWQDLRYAVRILLKSPGFTAVVVLSLALGIGANTAIFSMVNAYLLRPMPVDDPSRLVAIYQTAPRWGNDIRGMSYPELIDYRKQDTGLADLMGSTGIPLSLQEGATPELIWGEIVTGNYFSGLGVHPILGRGFLPDEDRAPGEKPVCVLSYNFWTQRFQHDPNVVGRSIKLNGHAFTVVGVAPRGFTGTVLLNFLADVWVPVMMQPTISSGNYMEGRGSRWISLRGRLKPGVSRQQAEAALNVVAQQQAREYPQTNRDLRVHVIPGAAKTQPFLVANGIVTATTGIMAAVVILVLLIACANVANLMLSRAAGRAKEMAVRVAIGATRMRLVRQLLTESVLLSIAGGVLGTLFALWFYDQLKAFYPSLDFATDDLEYNGRFDPRILAFTLLISLLTAVVFGLVPALRASKVDQVSAMKGIRPEVQAGRLRIGRGNLLVMLQVALSCVLLVFGGLFLRSMQFANSSDPGFYRTGITMFSLDLDLQGYDKVHGAVFQQNILDRMRRMPGVEAASYAYPLPMDTDGYAGTVAPEGYVPRSEAEMNVVKYMLTGPDYFSTMGTPIVAGRALDQRDSATSRRVVVINEAMARHYWQGVERSIGRRFTLGKSGQPMEVIGVAKDGKYNTYGEGETPYFFLPFSQNYQGRIRVLVRSRAGQEALVPAIREQVRELDPALPIFGIRTMPQFLNRMVALYDMGASLVGTFAFMAVILAAVGIYGVLHFTVARRTREIGIRMALGAPRSQVLRLVLQRSLLWVAAGLVLGVGIALAAGRLTGTLLAGVSGTDPATFVAVILGFGLIAAVASLVPARRASRVDPVRALRYE